MVEAEPRMDRGPQRAARPRWRHTLYARASLFLLVGGGALVGALIAMSSRLIDESVERLLDERLDLARAVGGLVEKRILSELEHLSHRAEDGLPPTGDPAKLRQALAQEYPVTIFKEGAIALSADMQPLVVLPSGPEQVAAAFDLRAMATEAAARDTPVVSHLVRLGAADRPVLVVLRPVRDRNGELRGFIGGMLHPTASDLLREVADVRGAAATALELVDAQGIVVASTTRNALYRSGDHGDVLEDAIARDRDFKGRCHNCHVEGADVHRSTDVMSFSPMPTLDLGLAVYQPEEAALAPAFDLRRQLTTVIAVVALFVLFLGFAVHSVVRPVVRLTRAVDALEASDGPARLPAFGKDEVGTLARSLELWRGRMVDAMNALDDSRRRSREEAEATRMHLEALEDIAAQSSIGSTVETILEHGLRHVLRAAGLSAGAMDLEWGEAAHRASADIDPERADRLLARAGAVQPAETARRLTAGGGGRCAVVTRWPGDGAEREETLTLTHLVTPHGLRIRAALTAPGNHEVGEDRWIHSLLYHVGMSATSRILRDREHVRQRQQERYLRGVLEAQEEERARIARDLHDTIAQDLAALRLDLERLGRRLPDSEAGAALAALEGRTAGILRTTRAILLDLRLTVLESMGFLATLQWHLERLQRDHSIRGVLSLDGEERRLGYYLSVALLRIFQECLNNVVQHARAEQVFVTVAFGEESLELTVEDDGRGFDPNSVLGPAQRERGLGVLGMQERARLLGGTLTITSQPGEGASVSVRVPLEAGRVATTPTRPPEARP